MSTLPKITFTQLNWVEHGIETKCVFMGVQCKILRVVSEDGKINNPMFISGFDIEAGAKCFDEQHYFSSIEGAKAYFLDYINKLLEGSLQNDCAYEVDYPKDVKTVKVKALDWQYFSYLNNAKGVYIDFAGTRYIVRPNARHEQRADGKKYEVFFAYGAGDTVLKGEFDTFMKAKNYVKNRINKLLTTFLKANELTIKS